MITDSVVGKWMKDAYVLIENFIKDEACADKKIALWGAGKKSKEFLSICDPFNRYIRYVYDKNENLYGQKTPTGHVICDYRIYPADIVLVISNGMLWETKSRLEALPKETTIISIDDVILGGRKHLNGIAPLRLWGVKKIVKVAALVILYNPDRKIWGNIASYNGHIDKLYIFDNSPDSHESLCREFMNKNKCVYIYNDGENCGLGKPINVVANIAWSEGVEWLLTFDQDSKAEIDMVENMLAYVSGEEYDPQIGVLSPIIDSPTDANSDIAYLPKNPHVMYLRTAIQSGSLLNLRIMNEVGGYKENLFIDYVDFEYCLRVRSMGYKVARLTSAKLLHQEEDKYEVREIDNCKLYLGKYKPERFYYQCRNILYCMEKYRRYDPIFVRECATNLARLKKLAEFENESKEIGGMIEKAEREYVNLL